MDSTFITELVKNAALLMSLGLIYDVLSRHKFNTHPIAHQIPSGLIIGGITIVLMLSPLKYESGIIFDTRTILLSLSGLYFGAIPALMAMALAGAYRISLGGGGSIAGVATIISSCLIGLAWRHFRYRTSKELSLLELYLFGCVVHVVMILCMFLLPQGMIFKTISSIFLPVILIYPVCTVLLGALLAGSHKRYRIEEELHETTGRYNQLAHQSRTVAWEVDATGLYTYLSPVAELVYGFKPEELVGKKHFYDIHPAAWREEFKDAAMAVFERKAEFVNIDNQVQTRDGGVIWVRTNGLPIVAPDGILKGYRGSDEDVTDRRRANEELERHQFLLKTIIESTSQAIYAKDTSGKYLSINEAGARMLGYSISDIVGRTDTELFLAETAAEFRKTDEDVLSRGQAYEREEQGMVDGAMRTFLAHKTPWSDISGNVIGVIGISNDITERKRTEVELLEYKNKISQLLEATDQGIYGIDVEGHCTFINRAGLEIIGCELADCLGKDMHDLIHHTYSGGLPYEVENCPIYRARLSGVGSRVDSEVFWRKDGTAFQTEYSSYPIVVNGHISGAVITFSDITARKQAEEEKVKLEAQLHQAQKLESVGSLAGGVAHDFNNKLSVILGHAYLALSESIPSQVHDSLVEIRKAAEQSADLTRQLLAFARKQTIAPMVLDLNETVSGMLKMLNRLIGEDIRLNWQPAADLWLLKLDPSQIDQILANLCVNARDSIAENGKITIETGNSTIDGNYYAQNTDAVPGEYVRLSISDNGCGMDNETMNRIFEPFFTTKETGKGTGLGLATVFGIVKQNNGFINVYSEPGMGTTFTIYLPRHMGKTLPDQQEGITMSVPVGQETILLVEDELAILNMASMILTKQGYKVLTANTPAEAISLADKNAGAISLLITDVIMPGMNGKDLNQTLQSQYPQLKCLFMSGYTADAIAHHGVLDEGVNFIQKPFSFPDLAIKVRAVIDSEK